MKIYLQTAVSSEETNLSLFFFQVTWKDEKQQQTAVFRMCSQNRSKFSNILPRLSKCGLKCEFDKSAESTESAESAESAESLESAESVKSA